MIAIVDYGINNLASVENAIRAVGGEAQVTADPNVIAGAEGVILPGIGAASAGMQRIRARGLDGAIKGAALSGRPFLGICLGMQLLFESSEEGDTPCLGVLPGRVTLIQRAVVQEFRKLPQIGWNQVEIRSDSMLWRGMGSDPYFYFVHSYICEPADAEIAAGATVYGVRFCSAVESGSLWGTQFHPERSGAVGLQLIKNFIDCCAN